MANLEDLIDPEYGLQQDEWSLTRPKFGEHGQLEVIGWSGKGSNSAKVYLAVCSFCRADRELWGEGIFRAKRSEINGGKTPCGCWHKKEKTPTQWEVIMGRICKQNGNKFKGFASSFTNANKTKVMQECPVHGIWGTSSISQVSRCGSNCPKCAKERHSKLLRREDEQFKLEFMSTEAYPEGTIFRRKGERGCNWEVFCPECNDVWVARSTQLKAGLKSCFCGKEELSKKHSIRATKNIKNIRKRSIPKTIAKFRLTGAFHEDTVFTLTEKVNCRDARVYWDVVCGACGDNYHSERAILLQGLVGCSCRVYSHTAQTIAYINFISDRELPICLKFGITSDHKRRLYSQNKTCTYTVTSGFVYNFPSATLCRKAEVDCLTQLQCGVLTKEEMPDGYTETTWVYNLEKIIAIYEKHGGVRVED